MDLDRGSFLNNIKMTRSAVGVGARQIEPQDITAAAPVQSSANNVGSRMSGGLSGTMPELNNNSARELFEYKRGRNASLVSVSSASSCHSDDSSEEAVPAAKTQNPSQEKRELPRLRSNSDGAARQRTPVEEAFEVFPSLPDTVLDKMGLLGNGPRERLNEEELEQKFVALSLAFSIDAATIKDRCGRQRRYRDQTETNLAVEIERLTQKANRIQPLCVDAETTELLSALLTQIDVVVSACSHATIASERYGAVQHEERISESVNLMTNHVNLLKQQRDSARRHLQYTKKVLQNSNGSSSPSKVQNSAAGSRLMTKRRASIATISQPSGTDFRKITRRTSDLSIRASSLSRNSRPGRLELGLDLVKIKEGMVENEPMQQEETPNQSENESIQNDDVSSLDNNDNLDVDLKLTSSQRLWRKIRKFKGNLQDVYNNWTEDGSFHEICYLCAIICFTFSIVTMTNILIEVEFSKREINFSSFFWFSTSNNNNNNNLPFSKTYKRDT